MQNNRIIGYDIARALAVFIMVVVNFNLVLSTTTERSLLASFLELLQGKGAVLFVILAGAGISLMIKKNLLNNDKEGLKLKRKILLKRALFLFVVGMIFLPLWPADILHYYGFYLLIATLFLRLNNKILWTSIILIIGAFPLLMMFVDYETGWNWKLNEYIGFWTVSGFFRNLLFNGFHPLLPWVSFVIAGTWMGRQDLSSARKRKTIFWISLIVFVSTQLLSMQLIKSAVSFLEFSVEDATAIFGTQPMPPLPLFMISGISWSFVAITICIAVSEKAKENKYLQVLATTGQLAFTHYIAHIIVGILSAYLFFGENSLSVSQAFLYAGIFCMLLMGFSVLWRKKFKRGPLSLLMRSITG